MLKCCLENIIWYRLPKELGALLRLIILGFLNKEIQPVHSKGDQSWVFLGRTDAEAEAPILWPPEAESWLIGKDLMLGKIECGRRKGQQRMRWLDGITDTMDVGLWTLGVGDGQGGLACCVVHGVSKSQTRLNGWTELNWTQQYSWSVICS